MEGYGCRVASLLLPENKKHHRKKWDLLPEILVFSTKEQLKFMPCCSAAMPQLFLHFFLLSTAAMTRYIEIVKLKNPSMRPRTYKAEVRLLVAVSSFLIASPKT